MLSSLHRKIVIIIQARMGSTRLPGKSMKELLGMPMLAFLLERLSLVKLADSIVVATSDKPEDDSIAALCEAKKIPCFRGSEEDVLSRYKGAAEKAHATAVVRISGDCPLMDPAIVDQIIQRYIDLAPEVDYVSNTLERTFPRGMDVELFSKSALDQAEEQSKKREEREHVTPYIYRHPELFHLHNVRASKDHSSLRLTVDTPADFQLIHLICEALYPTKPQFTLEDILKLFHKHPEWISINADIKQKTIDQR